MPQDPGVYLTAASLISAGWEVECCPAIRKAGGTLHESLQFNLLFQPFDPNSLPDRVYNAVPFGVWWGKTEADRRQCRVIALCLMDAIAKETNPCPT